MGSELWYSLELSKTKFRYRKENQLNQCFDTFCFSSVVQRPLTTYKYNLSYYCHETVKLYQFLTLYIITDGFFFFLNSSVFRYTFPYTVPSDTGHGLCTVSVSHVQIIAGSGVNNLKKKVWERRGGIFLLYFLFVQFRRGLLARNITGSLLSNKYKQ